MEGKVQKLIVVVNFIEIDIKIHITIKTELNFVVVITKEDYYFMYIDVIYYEKN